MNIPEFNPEKLIELLLDQKWQRECVIIPDYMPPYPHADTRPSVVVKYPNEFEDVFLRYSQGPHQGYFWDIFGDDLMTIELAIFALHKAPIPANYKKRETSIVVKFPLLRNKEGK
jgi:hypothetical protein